ncbi:MAG: sensor histidine kinase [Bacteroidales bacterium]|jgi:sensor histidine kinase YesM|nr:sensor histidine kinase [Bacteroidales bacterium]
MEDTKHAFRKWLHNIVKKWSGLLIIVMIFLSLFVGGMRFNVYISFLLAVLDTLFIAAVYLFFDYFFKRNKFFKSYTSQIVVIILCLIALPFLFLLLELVVSKQFFSYLPTDFSRYTQHFIAFRFLKNMVLTLGAFSIVQFNYSRMQKEKAIQFAIEKEHLRFQLLKAQVNPHFLFNALNNIYALAYTKDEKTPDAVSKLADMLRYVIDVINMSSVQLNKEIDYIRNYLDFQLMRLGKQVDIQFEVDVDNLHQFIAPMILQPYIENCFNHGDISTNPEGYVHIALHVKAKKLNFTLSNSKGIAHYASSNQHSGLGELNVEQRLQLFYKDAFTLIIEEEDTHYRVTLNIDLNMKINDAKQ